MACQIVVYNLDWAIYVDSNTHLYVDVLLCIHLNALCRVDLYHCFHLYRDLHLILVFISLSIFLFL